MASPSSSPEQRTSLKAHRETRRVEEAQEKAGASELHTFQGRVWHIARRGAIYAGCALLSCMNRQAMRGVRWVKKVNKWPKRIRRKGEAETIKPKKLSRKD